MEASLKQTPLYQSHQQYGARMVDFAGWSMPVLYTGILEEARAVRNHAGIFDISHMGRLRIGGKDAAPLLQALTTNDVDALKEGEAHYSLLTNPDGGIIDDIIVYRSEASEFLVVINASNTSKDINWIEKHRAPGAFLEEKTAETAMIAIQGPEAPAILAGLAPHADLLTLGRFHHTRSTLLGAEATFCRTGYTGEDGFEVIVPADSANKIWEALVDRGSVPCGLGARDALRIEAGYPLYGHEIDDETTPVEAGLMWAVKMSKDGFIGKAAIAAVQQAGSARKLVGMVSQERIQPRQGYNIYVQAERVGNITSGIFSPVLNRSVAMGYVLTPYSKSGTQVEIAIRDKRAAATIVPKKNLLNAQI